MGLHRKLFYNSIEENDDSLANRMRRKRMKVFESFFEEVFKDRLNCGQKIRILDIGGTYKYWKHLNFKYLSNCEFTLLNLIENPIPEEETLFTGVIDDATNMAKIEDNHLIWCSAIRA